MWRALIDDEVRAGLDAIDVGFNVYGLDEFGVSRDHLGLFYSFLKPFYRRYFRVEPHGLGHVPRTGRAMLIGNHSGGLPVDAGMCVASLLLDHEPPRIVHGMVEKFANLMPFTSAWFSRLGQLTGLPEHAVRLLEAERLLMVFPEGARGTGKLYKDRYELVRFGTGFMRIALETGTPIVPFAFVGGEEAIPTVYHSELLAKPFHSPYFPITPYGIPWPLPVKCSLHFGAPLRFEGTGTESDAVIEENVETVKARIRELIAEGREMRQGFFG